MKHRLTVLLAVLGLLGGCGGAPQRPATVTPALIAPGYAPNLGDRIVAGARSMIGVPYRYGGTSPQGFDCSGLVQYAHSGAGIAVPRTTPEQYDHARSIRPAELRPGDVVFFKLTRQKASHVGIYAGGGRFIHAPARGSHVSMDSLENPYWRQRIVKTGRFY